MVYDAYHTDEWMNRCIEEGSERMRGVTIRDGWMDRMQGGGAKVTRCTQSVDASRCTECS